MGSLQRSIAILKILLKQYRPITYTDIQRELLKNYDEYIDRRTIKSHVNTLSKMFDIIRRDSKGQIYVETRLGGKTVYSFIKSSLWMSNELQKMVA